MSAAALATIPIMFHDLQPSTAPNKRGSHKGYPMGSLDAGFMPCTVYLYIKATVKTSCRFPPFTGIAEVVKQAKERANMSHVGE